MNTTELVNILRTDQHTRVLNPAVKPLNHFLEEPLNRPSMTIVNLDSCDEPGSHWVAVYVPLYGDTEYFDSYGDKPNGLFFLKFQELNTKIVYSNSSFQGISTVCGQYCLIFLLLRSRNYLLDEIISSLLLCDSPTERDMIVNDRINDFFKNVLKRKLEVVDEKFITNII